MTIIRVFAAATIAGSVGALVGVLTAPSASAAALAEGSYTFTFDGSNRTTDGKPDPMHMSVTFAGIRSACPPA
jgi:lambda family phage tail tape measure protein